MSSPPIGSLAYSNAPLPTKYGIVCITDEHMKKDVYKAKKYVEMNNR